MKAQIKMRVELVQMINRVTEYKIRIWNNNGNHAFVTMCICSVHLH